jgi:hypothetical protein
MIPEFPWSSLFLIFGVITNVTTVSMPSMSPTIFIDVGIRGSCAEVSYIAAVLIVKPILIKYCSRPGIAYILFVTHYRIRLDFGVFFAWIAVSLALYPFTTFYLSLEHATRAVGGLLRRIGQDGKRYDTRCES